MKYDFYDLHIKNWSIRYQLALVLHEVFEADDFALYLGTQRLPDVLLAAGDEAVVLVNVVLNLMYDEQLKLSTWNIIVLYKLLNVISLDQIRNDNISKITGEFYFVII
jgi:hypothetical protein